MNSAPGEAAPSETTWKSTEFWQSVFVQVTGFYGLMTERVSDDAYGFLSATALGIYVAGRSYQKRERWRSYRDDDHAPRLED